LFRLRGQAEIFETMAAKKRTRGKGRKDLREKRSGKAPRCLLCAVTEITRIPKEGREEKVIGRKKERQRLTLPKREKREPRKEKEIRVSLASGGHKKKKRGEEKKSLHSPLSSPLESLHSLLQRREEKKKNREKKRCNILPSFILLSPAVCSLIGGANPQRGGKGEKKKIGKEKKKRKKGSEKGERARLSDRVKPHRK